MDKSMVTNEELDIGIDFHKASGKEVLIKALNGASETADYWCSLYLVAMLYDISLSKIELSICREKIIEVIEGMLKYLNKNCKTNNYENAKKELIKELETWD